MILVLFASWAVYDSHVLKKPNPIPNLYSLHSWIGLAAVILFILQVIHVIKTKYITHTNVMERSSLKTHALKFQWLCGFFSFLYPLISPQQRENVMPFHVYFGVTGYVLAIAAALMGLNEKAIFKLSVQFLNTPF